MSIPPTGRARVPRASQSTEAPVRSGTGREPGRRPGDPPPRAGGQARRPGEPGRPPGARLRRRIRPRWGRIALVLGVFVGLIAGAVALAGYLYVNHVNSNLNRVDAFSSITGNRPPILVKGAQNILLLGSDSRNPSKAADLGGWRTDTIILMHITADHKKAYLISIPRDTWVFVPKSPSQPSEGNTFAKINAAFSWGGVPLTVQTVEGFTGVHIDHAIVINFGGFAAVTDALGGVDMHIDKTITSIHPPHRTFQQGDQHLNGAEALDYIRQRKQFPNGDFTRVAHQQEFLKDIMNKATSTGTLTNPAKLKNFLNAVSRAVVVDNTFDLASMAIQFRNLRSSDMTFLTSPSAGSGMRDGQSVVLSDKTKALALYQAVGRDTVATWLAANPAS